MHSSRMRTVRCSGRLRMGSAWLGVSARGGGCLPWGCVCPGVQECLSRYVSAQWGVSLGGVHLPPVDRMTDACEYITFPQQQLWTVIKKLFRIARQRSLAVHPKPRAAIQSSLQEMFAVIVGHSLFAATRDQNQGCTQMTQKQQASSRMGADRFLRGTVGKMIEYKEHLKILQRFRSGGEGKRSNVILVRIHFRVQVR